MTPPYALKMRAEVSGLNYDWRLLPGQTEPALSVYVLPRARKTKLKRAVSGVKPRAS